MEITFISSKEAGEIKFTKPVEGVKRARATSRGARPAKH